MKKIVGIFVILMILLLIPTLVSLPPFKQLWISRLETRFGGQIHVESASFSWLGPQRLKSVDYQDPALTAHAQEITSPLPFWRIGAFASRFELKNGSLQAQGGVGLEQIEVQVDPAHTMAHGSSSQGGIFQIEQTGSVINASLKQVPTILLDRMLKADGLLVAAIGDPFGLDGSFQTQNKEFQVQIVSPRSKAELAGTLKSNTLLLSKPLQISLQGTPELTNRLNLPPSKGPISLTISPDQFQSTIPPRLDTLQIGQGQIRAGVFEIGATSFFANVGSLLKNASRFRSSIEVRSTPIDFSVQKGTLTLQRLDFLLNRSIQLCLWGNIDLISEKLRLNLGIPAQTLGSLLGVPGLRSNAVLKVPVRGTISNPELDTSSASAKIAALTATQILPQKGLWQLVPKVVDTALDDQGDIPPQRYPLN